MKTIYEVAKKAHVSVATVSRVINNSGYVSKETREIVERTIKELGYSPNKLAVSFFSKRSFIIGLVVPHFASEYFSELIEILEQEISKRGYRLMVFNTNFEEVEKERLIIKTFKDYNIDGLVIVQDTKILNEYIQLKTPIVSIDRKLHPKIPSITSNNFLGGKLVGEQFIKNNRTNILQILGPTHLDSVESRKNGCDLVLNELNIPCDYMSTDFRYPHKDNIKHFIEAHPETDGIFCSSDTIAAATLYVLNKLGKKVPEDIDVIGFDNTSLCEFTSPTLSTIAQNLELIGQTTIDILEQQIKREKVTELDHQVDVIYIQRESTK